MTMTWFSLGRDEGFPANYGEQLTAANVDVLVSGLIAALVIAAVACFAVLPAYSARKRWLTLTGYVTVSLFVGGIALVCNFGHEWEVGHASIRSPYKPASAVEVVGELGLHISIRGVNITLRGDLQHDHDDHGAMMAENEVIDYNEHYSWEWAQGRFGFGPYAGRISREYRSSVDRGTPTPILNTAEYFTFDGEGLRFGRHYRLAGYYAHFFMWVAFCSWALANIALFMVVRFGAVFLTITGLAQLIAILLWANIRNSIEIQVPFESADGRGEVLLATRYGTDFWLVLVNGVLCTLGGIALFVLDDFCKEALCRVFGIDVLSVYVYEYQTKEEDDHNDDNNVIRWLQNHNHKDAAEPDDGATGGKIESTMAPRDSDLSAIMEDAEDQGDEKDADANDAAVIRRRPPSASAIPARNSELSPLPIIVQRRRTNGKSIYNAFTRRSQLPPKMRQMAGPPHPTPPFTVDLVKDKPTVINLRRDSDVFANANGNGTPNGKRMTSSDV